MSGAAVERYILTGRDHRLVKLPPVGSPFYMPDELVRAADYDRLTAELQQCRQALAWALPLAECAVETRRTERVQAGHHDIRGTYKNGVTWVGVYQSEVDEIESARAALKGQG